MQRNHGRWLGRNLLIAVAGISALLAAQSFEAPCEISWYLPLGQGSVPATIVDVAVASLVSCALIIAGNRGGRALASVPLAIASASCCLMGLAVQGTGEPLSIFGLILMSAGGTVLLFCWLAAVCAQRDIGIVELMIEVEVLASAAAILPSLLSASWCQALAGMSVAASAVALCLIQRPAPSSSEAERVFYPRAIFVGENPLQLFCYRTGGRILAVLGLPAAGRRRDVPRHHYRHIARTRALAL